MPAAELIVEPVARQGAADSAEHARPEAAPASGAWTAIAWTTHRARSRSRIPGAVAAAEEAPQQADSEQDGEDHQADQQQRSKPERALMGGPSAHRDAGGWPDLTEHSAVLGLRLGDLALDHLDALSQTTVEVPSLETVDKGFTDRISPRPGQSSEKRSGDEDLELVFLLRDQDVDALGAGPLGMTHSHVADRLTLQRVDRLDRRRDLRIALDPIERCLGLADDVRVEEAGIVADRRGVR
jgi:hypothetical protein